MQPSAASPDAAACSRPEVTHRILSIDGGGIYGLLSAIWLREVCQRDPTFLTNDQIQLFAGVSSGAINALLLAKYRDPREALLSGVLEAFWMRPVGAFSHQNPTTRLLSWFGLTAWCGAEDMLTLLEEHFGDMRLADLQQAVFISTYSLSGEKNLEFPRGRRGYPLDLAPDAPGRQVHAPEAGTRRWRPRYFTNLLDDPDGRYRVVDVAYGAASPLGFRAIRGGIVDAALFAGNPSMGAIATYAHWLDRHPDAVGSRGRSSAVPHDASASGPHVARWRDEVGGSVDPRAFARAGRHVDQFGLLSVGAGARIPYYWLKNFDFGPLPLAMLPTNPMANNWLPPMVELSLEGPMQDAIFASKRLLGDRYFRFDARVLELPTLVASLGARFWLWRQAMFERIYDAAAQPASRSVVEQAVEFVRNGWRLPL